jgi:hypothetical protein
MPGSRRVVLLVLLTLPAALLAACSSSGGGGGAGVPSGMPTDAAGLGTMLQNAVSKITSAHIALDITLAGQSLTGSGDETLANGRLTGLDLTENLPNGGGTIRVIMADGKTYAKLPPAYNSTDKPYLLVSDTSSNQVIRQLSASLDSALSSASLGSVSIFTQAAKSIDIEGTETVDGVQTVHYSIVVDVAKLPDSLPGKSDLTQSGIDTLPLELYVDPTGRPVQVTEAFTVQGQKVSTKSTVSDYNKPVTITAPPPDQVGN